MSVAIVTPWQNNLALAPAYFDAVEPEEPDQLVIVDDASAPPLDFAAVRLDEPKGFCGASNAGLEQVETDIVVFLNNDIVLACRGWLADLVDLVEPGVIVAPLRFDTEWQVRFAGEDVAEPYADGWCLAMTTQDARRIGGWDEAYDEAGPAYFSDNALSFQARMAGMRLRDIRSGLRHLGGRTGGQDAARFNAALAANGELYAAQVRKARA